MNKPNDKVTITLRLPLWLHFAINKKVATTVIANSTDNGLYPYTRSQLIIDSIIQHNGFIEALEPVQSEG